MLYFNVYTLCCSPQVWPLLLGLLPLHGTSEQQEELIRQKSSTYTAILQKWKTLELTHYENTDPTSTPIEIRLCSSSTTHPIINGGYTKTDNNSQTSLPPPSALNHTSPATVSNNSAQELVVDEPLLNGGSQMNGTLCVHTLMSCFRFSCMYKLHQIKGTGKGLKHQQKIFYLMSNLAFGNKINIHSMYITTQLHSVEDCICF